jgi:hypothetical protein
MEAAVHTRIHIELVRTQMREAQRPRTRLRPRPTTAA